MYPEKKMPSSFESNVLESVVIDIGMSQEVIEIDTTRVVNNVALLLRPQACRCLILFQFAKKHVSEIQTWTFTLQIMMV